MSVFVRFLKDNTLISDSLPSSLKISKTVGQSSEWDGQFASNTEDTQYWEEGDTVEIYFNGLPILEGLVQSVTRGDGTDETISVKGRDLTDTLFQKRSDYSAVYKETPVLAILCSLLAKAGWRLGNVSTFSDVTKIISVNLRSESNLMAQVSKIVSTFPSLSFRYAGRINDVPAIDVGLFGDDSFLRLVNAPISELGIDNEYTLGITGFSEETDSIQLLHSIETMGGEINDVAGNKRVISLRDAIIADETLLEVDEDGFVLLEEACPHRYKLINTNLTDGGTVSFYGRYVGTTGRAAGNQTIGGPANVTFRVAHPFYCHGGYLKEIGFTITSIVGTPGTGRVQVREYDGAGQPTHAEVIVAEGTFDANSAGVRKVVFDETIELEYGRYYALWFLGDDSLVTWQNYYVIPGFAVAGLQVSAYSHIWQFRNTDVAQSNIAGQGDFYITTSPRKEIVGIEKVMSFPEFAPDKKTGNATQPEINSSALSLYERSLAELKDNDTVPTKLKIKATGIAIPPEVGDSMYVDYHTRLGAVNVITNQPDIIEKKIQGDFKVGSYTINYTKNGVNWDINLSNEPNIKEADLLVELFKETKEKEPKAGEVFLPVISPSLVSSNHSISLESPNTTYEGKNAYEFNIDTPVSPNINAIPLLACLPVITSDTPYLHITVSQDFDSSLGQDAKIIIYSDREQGWQILDSIDFTVYIVWVDYNAIR